MPRNAVLEIDGVPYKGVYSVSYEITTAKDITGRPSDRARAGNIKIKRISDDNPDIARWAMDSAQKSWKPGKITFRDASRTLKELTWENGFITRYSEVLPDVEKAADRQIFEEFEISCQKLKIADAELDNLWDE